MLNISQNRVIDNINTKKYRSLNYVEQKVSGKVLIRLISILFGITFVIMFLPWTQNISARGKVTTLKPGQRPQTVHSVIAGRIEQWFVQEGDFVAKGDTLLHISEVKDDYFDPQLLTRTEEQLNSKKLSVTSYDEKVQALDEQVDALRSMSGLKLQQAQNKLQQARLKVTSDSIDFEAAQINFEIARQQFERMEKLYKDGLKSLTDLENRKLTLQKAQASMISAENKLLTSRNEEINARVELSSIRTDYRNKVAKAESDKFTAMSNKFDAEAAATKLQNQLMNYSVRSKMYFITAPQDGYITQAIQSGIGEVIKEGTEIMSIMPADYQLAVEMYIEPLDLPLLNKGQDVRIQFDGWPAIVFSGWPDASQGTYGGEIFAIDNFISPNGKYRVLVAPDPEEHPWPDALRVGAGTNSMVLLKDVMIWYELWRQINGFPPDYYQPSGSNEQAKK